MAREISLGANFPNKDTLASADSGQLLAAGAETTTFAVKVQYITVTYVDKDCYIAKTEAKVEATAGGARDDRIFIKADTRGLQLPWDGQNVYFLNATAAETPTIAVIGHA